MENDLNLPLRKPDPEKIYKISLQQLKLDPKNPRLASLNLYEGDRELSQKELVEMLWAEMSVNEVATSIAANGYLPTEPLFVIPEDPNQTNESKRVYIVIEGNRRLAAVLLLWDAKLRREIKATNLPAISPEILQELELLPVTIYPDRQSLWPYLGFRHINGPQKWDSFSKAQYVAKVYEEYGISLSEIAAKIGDYHSTVIRFYRGFTVLRQAEEQTSFNREDRAINRFSFSHLYTAVSYKEFQDFLEIKENSLTRNPVPQSKLDSLVELMTWLYGKKSAKIEPVVKKQDPDLNTLREVISKPASLDALRSGYPLETAYTIRIGDKGIFRNALTSAKIELQKAKSTVTTGYEGEDDLYRTIEDINRIFDSIWDEMVSIKEKMDNKRRNTRHIAAN